MNPENPSFKNPKEAPELVPNESIEQPDQNAGVVEAPASTEQLEQYAGVNAGFGLGSTLDGKYEIIDFLGAGGMSVVYKAKDLSLNRLEAVKILLKHHALDNKMILRFKQEARAAGALSHSGIVNIHEFAVSDNGQVYLVMDYVEGKALSSLIAEEGHLSVEKTLDIALQAADALNHAHEKGIIHRDLKPSNIMLIAGDGGIESVKIVDFGIAKITTLEEGQALTETGEVFGSPLYMSPEQCAGVRVDRRSDIYSLGCVMYEALTGRPPLKGETALATAVKHLQDEPERLRVARSDLSFPAALEAVISRTLEKDVSTRYQSMDELRSDLKLLRSGEDLKIGPSKDSSKFNPKRLIYSLVSLTIVLSSLYIFFNGLGTVLKDPYTDALDRLDAQAMQMNGEGKYQGAIDHLLVEGFGDYKEDANPVHEVYLAFCAQDLGDSCTKLKKYEQAANYYREALRIYSQWGSHVQPWQLPATTIRSRYSETVIAYAKLLQEMGKGSLAQSMLKDWQTRKSGSGWPTLTNVP